MTTPAENPVQSFMHSNDRSVWATAALVLAVSGSGTEELQREAATVLRALGLDLDQDTSSMDRGGVAAQAAAPVHQVAALLRGEGQMWAEQSDEALLAQGRASAQAASMMARFGVPALEGLGAALATPGARMLDVGTGVAAMAVSYANQFPAVTVVGIDVMPRVLALAARTVADSTVGDRVVLRQQDVGDLDERDTYAFAWLPAPFVPETALRRGIPRLADSLVPGGWLMLGHGRFAGDPVDDAVSRFKTIAYGGTPLDDDQAEELLRQAGLGDVMTMPTPPGSPAITVGRKPSQG